MGVVVSHTATPLLSQQLSTRFRLLITGEVTSDGANCEITQSDGITNIEFSNLRTSEEIIIETKNSSYRFAVSDALNRRGYLSGGSIGDEPVSAVLMGVVTKGGDNFVRDSWCLKTSGRAFFCIETRSGIKHLVTSNIIGLIHVKNMTEQKYIF